MRYSTYHSVLRVFALTIALILVFDSGILSPVTSHISDGTWKYVANSVGVFAQIEQNELNKITAELSARERELDEREASLRTIEARNFGLERDQNYSSYILSIILFILTMLVIVNYVLDWRRARMA